MPATAADDAQYAIRPASGDQYQRSSLAAGARCPGSCAKPLAREEAERGHATSHCSLRCGGFVSASRTSAWGGNSGTGRHVLRRAWRLSVRALTFAIRPDRSHAPFSQEGCVLAGQIASVSARRLGAQVCIDTARARWLPGSGTCRSCHCTKLPGERVVAAEMGRTGERPILWSLRWRGDLLCCRVNSTMSKAPIPEAPGSAIRRWRSSASVRRAGSGHLDKDRTLVDIRSFCPASLHSRSAMIYSMRRIVAVVALPLLDGVTHDGVARRRIRRLRRLDADRGDSHAQRGARIRRTGVRWTSSRAA